MAESSWSTVKDRAYAILWWAPDEWFQIAYSFYYLGRLALAEAHESLTTSPTQDSKRYVVPCAITALWLWFQWVRFRANILPLIVKSPVWTYIRWEGIETEAEDLVPDHHLGTIPDVGLSHQEASARLSIYGYNELVSPWFLRRRAMWSHVSIYINEINVPTLVCAPVLFWRSLFTR